MKPTYRIKDWDRHFENAKSRTIDSCSFVCIPNKQHGLGFTRIMAEPDGAAIFGIWVLLVEAVSRQSRPRAGWLTEDGTSGGAPWASDDLALRWRRTTKEISRALTFLSSSGVGWIEVEQVLDEGKNGGIQSESLGPIPQELEVSAGYPPGIQITEGTEQNRTERIEQNVTAQKSRAATTHKTLVPEDFRPSDKTMLWASEKAPDVQITDSMVDEFINYWLGEGGKKANWDRAFRNRLSKLQGWVEQRKGSNGTNRPRFESASERNSRNLQENVAYIRGLSNSGSETDSEDPIGLLASGS
jgi:hypothetical protein